MSISLADVGENVVTWTTDAKRLAGLAAVVATGEILAPATVDMFFTSDGVGELARPLLCDSSEETFPERFEDEVNAIPSVHCDYFHLNIPIENADMVWAPDTMMEVLGRSFVKDFNNHGYLVDTEGLLQVARFGATVVRLAYADAPVGTEEETRPARRIREFKFKQRLADALSSRHSDIVAQLTYGTFLYAPANHSVTWAHLVAALQLCNVKDFFLTAVNQKLTPITELDRLWNLCSYGKYDLRSVFEVHFKDADGNAVPATPAILHAGGASSNEGHVQCTVYDHTCGNNFGHRTGGFGGKFQEGEEDGIVSITGYSPFRKDAQGVFPRHAHKLPDSRQKVLRCADELRAAQDLLARLMNEEPQDGFFTMRDRMSTFVFEARFNNIAAAEAVRQFNFFTQTLIESSEWTCTPVEETLQNMACALGMAAPYMRFGSSREGTNRCFKKAWGLAVNALGRVGCD